MIKSINQLFMQKRQVPLGVTLISSFYLFGSFVLLFLLLTNWKIASDQIATVQGFSKQFGAYPLVFTIFLGLFIAYGLYSLARWGFFLTILYLLHFGSINFLLLFQHNGTTPFLGNVLWSIIVILYLLMKIKIFMNPHSSPPNDSKTYKDFYTEL